MKKHTGGFTLIELLVVISIIGILTVLASANYVGFKQRGRDAQRKSNLRQIQNALELYRSDQGVYPTAGVGYPTSCGGQIINGTTVYMQTVPCDPMGAGIKWGNGNYYYVTNGSTYTLGACLENVSDADLATVSTPPDGSATCVSSKYYVLQNP